MESSVAEKEDISTTGQQNNHNEVIDDLQNQVSSLEIRLKQARNQNQELEQQLASFERENLQLRQQEKTAGASVQPDYEATRDSEALRRTAERTLNKLKVGMQSSAGKAIDAFIKELRHLEKPKASHTTAASLVKEAYKRYEESGFVHTDVYENALRQIACLCGFKLLQDIKKKNFYITPKDDRGQRLVTSSSIGGIVEFLSSQPLLSPEASAIATSTSYFQLPPTSW